MFNWSEIEQVTRMRIAQLSECLSDDELARLELIAELDAARKPLKARIAAALVRLGARLDPDTIVLKEAFADHDMIREGRLAAYLR